MSRLSDRPRSRLLKVALATLGGAILLVVGLVTWESTRADNSAAQPIRRVGLMHVGTDHIPSSWPALKARLQELGWTDGENIKLMWRNLEPYEVAAQASTFLGLGVDVIVAFEDSSISAAQAVTTSSGLPNPIPVVFLHPSDPVRDGLVESLAHPDTNLTGVYGARDEVDKQLEIYQLLVPRLHRMLTLVDSSDPRTERLLPGYQAAAAQLQRPLELDIREASSAQDLRRIFRSLRPGEVDGAFLLSPSLRLNHSALTIRLAKRARLRSRPTARSGSSRGRSSRTGSTSSRSVEPAHVTSTASSGARRPASCRWRSSRSSSSRSISRPPAGSGSRSLRT